MKLVLWIKGHDKRRPRKAGSTLPYSKAPVIFAITIVLTSNVSVIELLDHQSNHIEVLWTKIMVVGDGRLFPLGHYSHWS